MLIAGNARCNRSFSDSRCRSAAVVGSGPQIQSGMASLTAVAAYSIRSTIHDQNRDIMLQSLGIVVVKSGVSGGYGAHPDSPLHFRPLTGSAQGRVGWCAHLDR